MTVEGRDSIEINTSYHRDLSIGQGEASVAMKYESVPEFLYLLASINGTDFLSDDQQRQIKQSDTVSYANLSTQRFAEFIQDHQLFFMSIWSGIDRRTGEPIKQEAIHALRRAYAIDFLLDEQIPGVSKDSRFVGSIDQTPGYYPHVIHILTGVEGNTHLVQINQATEEIRHVVLSPNGLTYLARHIVEAYGLPVSSGLQSLIGGAVQELPCS